MRFTIILLGLMFCFGPMYSQVTIGADEAPEPFAVLELISNQTSGLRLPQLTTQQRIELTTEDFAANPAAEGLTIFNTDTKCVEVWNGTAWISLCPDGTIGMLSCTSVTGINVTQGTEANVTATLPYSGKLGANIALLDGQILGGPVSGLLVLVSGLQTLYDPSGEIEIKIAGTATTYGTIDIPIILAGASCYISVTVAQQAGTITKLLCGNVGNINLTQGVESDQTATLPYTGLSGSSILLTDGTVIGEISGLSIVANGTQTLSDEIGSIAFKVVGTPITFGPVPIPVSLAGANCNIDLTVTQQGGTIDTLYCTSITGVKVIQGFTANVTAELPYGGKKGTYIDLPNGAVLGSEHGLSAVIDGSQRLSDPNGIVYIKIIGKADVTGKIYITVNLAGATCSIEVISGPNPSNLTTGNGNLTGRICFDVVEINNGGDCGTLAGRTSQKANFKDIAIYKQIYTYTISGSVSNIRFYVDDPTGLVVQSYTPEGYPGTSLTGSRTFTVNYFTELNNTASGLTRTNALIATLYVVYNDKADGTGTDKKLSLQVRVQDCSCCPGYLAIGKEYTPKTSGYMNSWASPSNFSTIVSYFTATGKSICFFKTDYASQAAAVTEARAVCNAGSFTTDASLKAMGWRLPNIAELGSINSVATSLSSQSTSITGTTNMSNSPTAGQGAYYWSDTQRDANTTWGWSYGQGATQFVSVSNHVRCVRTQ